jgi:hypothetical protein
MSATAAIQNAPTSPLNAAGQVPKLVSTVLHAARMQGLAGIGYRKRLA